MLRKPGHDKREDISLTLYEVWKETAVCSNAGTCLIVHPIHTKSTGYHPQKWYPYYRASPVELRTIVRLEPVRNDGNLFTPYHG